MKVILEKDKNRMSNKLKIFYVVIIIICIISVIVAIFIQSKTEEEEYTNKLPQMNKEQIDSYKNDFYNIFQNKVNYMENNSYKITKVDKNEEIVYIGYQIEENKINDYELNVNIPYINIVNEKTEEFNEQIREIFEKKAKSILNTQGDNIIYTVDYSAYVTNNILSLVIRSTLKEGANPQRDIIQTYNYDLTNQKEYTMEDFLNIKGITKQEANQKIREEIKKVQESVSQLRELGYNVYTRNPDSDIYSINNVTEYFIGENNALYIIFAYGNENNTTEMDMVVM